MKRVAVNIVTFNSGADIKACLESLHQQTFRDFAIHILDNASQYDKPGEIFGPSGAAALYRRKALDDTAIDGQYFDEDFFAYREDADLAWRCRLLGWNAIYVPGAVALHRRRVTPERRRELPKLI